MSPVNPGIPRKPEPAGTVSPKATPAGTVSPKATPAGTVSPKATPAGTVPPKARARAEREEQRRQRELARAARAAGMVPESARRPLEPGRARGILAGLLIFGLGFAALAAFTASGAGTGLRTVCILAGFTGAGLVAAFLNRGTAPLPEAPIWSPTGLRAVAGGLGLPGAMVMVAVYGLIVIGVVGNILVPLTRG